MACTNTKTPHFCHRVNEPLQIFFKNSPNILVPFWAVSNNRYNFHVKIYLALFGQCRENWATFYSIIWSHCSRNENLKGSDVKLTRTRFSPKNNAKQCDQISWNIATLAKINFFFLVFLRVYIVFGKNLTYFGKNYECYWANLYCCKRQNIDK